MLTTAEKVAKEIFPSYLSIFSCILWSIVRRGKQRVKTGGAEIISKALNWFSFLFLTPKSRLVDFLFPAHFFYLQRLMFLCVDRAKIEGKKTDGVNQRIYASHRSRNFWSHVSQKRLAQCMRIDLIKSWLIQGKRREREREHVWGLPELESDMES